MQYDKREINELLKIIKADAYNKAAFTLLYKKLEKAVLLVACRYLRKTKYRWRDLEDIVGNTFVKVIEKIDRFYSIKNGAAWVFKITENLCKMFARKNNKKVGKNKIETEPEQKKNGKISFGTTLDKLDESERAIFFLNEATYNSVQISRILKMSNSTVRRRIQETIPNLASNLKKAQ